MTKVTDPHPLTEVERLAEELELHLDAIHSVPGRLVDRAVDDLGTWAFNNSPAILQALRQSPPLPSIDEVRREAFEEAAALIEQRNPNEGGREDAKAIRALSNMRVDAPKGLDDG